MDQSINIPWSQGMNYGMGVNLLNGYIAGKAVAPGESTSPKGSAGQTATYDVTLLRSAQELYSAIGIDIAASGHYGLFSAEGKFKYSNSVKFNTQATFLLARCVVENAFRQCEDAHIVPDSDAYNLLKRGQTTPFQARYGDGFVRGMKTGGEFFVVLSITSSDTEAQTSVAASVLAEFGGFFGGGSLSAGISEETKSRLSQTDYHVSTYQRGGQGDELAFTKDVDAVMDRLQKFPGQVLDNPVPYEVQIASYNTLALPGGPNLIEIEAQKRNLEKYERTRLTLQAISNDIEFLQRHPSYFVDPPPSETANDAQTFIARQITELTKRASDCLEDAAACETFALQTPPGWVMPERKSPTPGRVVIYAGEDYNGQAQTLFADRYDNAKAELLIGNDALRSLKVPKGRVVRLYEHFHFQGRFIDIREETPSLGQWNDRVSSLVVYGVDEEPPRTREVVLFEGPNLGGAGPWRVLGPGAMSGHEIAPGGAAAMAAVASGAAARPALSALIPKGMGLAIWFEWDFEAANGKVNLREDTPNILLGGYVHYSFGYSFSVYDADAGEKPVDDL